MKSLLACLSILILLTALVACNKQDNSAEASSPESMKRVLIFSKTSGWRHQSIEHGTEKLKQSLANKNIEVFSTEDPSIFNNSDLADFSALIFLNTTGDILNTAQQIAMERYIQAGGGYVGIHSASDTEHRGDWYWYRRLVGGVFAGHPSVPSNVQEARIKVLRKDHPSTSFMPDNFSIADEWYDFKSLSERRIDLLSIDENSYNGGAHGVYHPIAWYHEFDGGRSFYTGLGHNKDNYDNPIFMQHLLGGIEYAIGVNKRDYSLSRPEPNRFNKEVLLDNLTEPVSLAVSKDGSAVIFVERKGSVKWFDTLENSVSEIANIDVYSAEGFGEFGLLMVALDPNFATNQHLYLMYNVASTALETDAPETDAPEVNGPLQRLSRYTLKDGRLDISSRVVMLDFANDDTCCHTGGNLEFDQQGNLFIAIGDNTNPFESFGAGPGDFRDGRAAHDAYRSSANTQDLRGKILRITPQEDGSYTIPEGNLFSDPADGRPEIYVMGTRNPYTIAFDDKEQTLYYGDVGPDAPSFEENYGARGHDEINRVRQAGNFGWPMFIANNKAYRQYDMQTQTTGAWNNPLQPNNLSPRNTGSKKLPPAQGAYVYYPYAQSDIFPELGSGSRNALVAGVYRHEALKAAQTKQAFPEYYEGGLFISDFMRRWIKVVFSDDNGDIYKIEEFMPDAEFAAPLDLTFSKQGVLYVLEYGSKWHAGNIDARLSRVVFNGYGNRSPQAILNLSAKQGASPLTVEASGEMSSDPDTDPLSFSWQVVKLNEQENAQDANYAKAFKRAENKQTEFNFDEKGRYGVMLSVADDKGKTSQAFDTIEVGNAPPTVNIAISGNSSFIWPKAKNASYTVSINDLEDGIVNERSDAIQRVYISLLKQQNANADQALGHLANDPLGPGRSAAKKHLCLGCHQEQTVSVGPSFQQVADKYQNLDDPVAYLVSSIAKGSAGKWGEHQMPPHNFLADEVLAGLSTYIMQLKSKPPSLTMTGELPTVEEEGGYILTATYTDGGAPGLSMIEMQGSHRFLSPTVTANQINTKEQKSDNVSFTGGNIETMSMTGSNSYILLGEYDLRQVSGISILQKFQDTLDENARFELRLDQPTGEVISSGQFVYADGLETYNDVSINLNFSAINQKRKVYLSAVNPEAPDDRLCASIYSVTFLQL